MTLDIALINIQIKLNYQIELWADRFINNLILNVINYSSLERHSSDSINKCISN